MKRKHLIAAALAAAFVLPMMTMQSASAGERTDRILNGAVAQSGEFPDFITITKKANGTSVSNHICGGVLISPHWAVTAAHCVSLFTDESQVMVGMESYSPLVVKDQVDIEKVVAHPDFDPNSLEGEAKNDIALIKLSRPANSTSFARLAGFDPAQEPPTALTNIPLTAAGFGNNENGVNPNVLYKATLTALPEELCMITPPGARPTNEDPEYHVCAGHAIGGGDSGGPLYADYNGKRFVVGVVSRSLTPPAEQFTRVSHFADWIKETAVE